MNVFKLLVMAVGAVALLYIILLLFAPLFSTPPNIAHAAEGLLLTAQTDLGKSYSTTLDVRAEQSLDARSLDEPSRSVAFACSGIDCCDDPRDCPLPLTVNAQRILFHQDIRTTFSARCEETAGIHACTVYVGKRPAQLEWRDLVLPEVNNGDDLPYVAQATIFNTGEIILRDVTVLLRVYESQVFAGNEEKIIIHTQEQIIPALDPSSGYPLAFTETILPGNYTIDLFASAQEGGFDRVRKDVHITGETISLCQPILENRGLGTWDGFTELCRAQRDCTGCTFAFECREAWERTAPLSGGGSYDASRGEPGFTYALYEPVEGSC
ncbi:MAG: hypothetical protein Q8P05_01920 [Candidatus Diapherotrites archaeon]|nr:hypothetical protein [Candidatus Diapherotrites archaeon]MDZ4256950.1 hypothetical protein [archaeon]